VRPQWFQAHPPQDDLFVSNVGTRLGDRARRSLRCSSKPVAGLAIVRDVGAHGFIGSPGIVDQVDQHVLDITPSCFYLPWGDARESRNILSIKTSSHNLDLWGVSHTERERERDRGVRASAVSECVLFV